MIGENCIKILNKKIKEQNNVMKKEIEQEMAIRFSIVLTNAISNPLAVMIHPEDTNIASSTVVITRWLDSATNYARLC